MNVSDYLFGNILRLGDADLWIIYLISLVALPTLVALERPLLLTMFEPAVASSQGVPVNSVKLPLDRFGGAEFRDEGGEVCV